MVNVIIKDRSNTREADYALIQRGLNSRDPNTVRQAMIAKDRINGEDKRIRDMREALIKAHRNGDKEKVKDIHDSIKSDWRYKNGW